MNYRLGQRYYIEFVTTDPNTGASQNADSLPTASINVNGVDDSSMILTVSGLDIGRYLVSGTIPLTYEIGNIANISVSATVNGISGKSIIDSFQIETLTLSGIIEGVENSTIIAKEATNQMILETVSADDILINDLHDAQFGRSVLNWENKTLTLYRKDNVSIVKQFSLVEQNLIIHPITERNPI